MITIYESGNFISKDWFNAKITTQRTVQYYELELYSGGDGFSIVNGIKYPHEGCHFIFAKPGDQRFSIGEFECLYIHFVSDEPELESIQSYIANPSSTTASQMTDLVKASGLKRISKVCALLDELRYCAVRHCDSEKYIGEILKTKEYMEQNYGSRIALDDLAGMVYLSKNFYRTTFQRIMEISPQKYLQKIRISKAVELIRQNEMSLCEIAQSCGFENQSYMNYCFKRSTGKTPTEFKK